MSFSTGAFIISGLVLQDATITKTDGTQIDVNSTGTGTTSSNQITVGDPTEAFSSQSGISAGDSVADALQKIDELLVANLPIPLISIQSSMVSLVMTLEDSTFSAIQLYSAIPAGGTVPVTNVTDKQIVHLAETPPVLEDPGTLTLKFTNAGVTNNFGTVTLVAGASNNLLTNGNLQVTFDGDPNPDYPSQTDIAFRAKATCPAAPLPFNSSQAYAYTLELDPSGPNPTTSTPPVTFYVDDVSANPTPVVDDINFVNSVGTSYQHVSGVPCFLAGSQITVELKVHNIMGNLGIGFYNSNKVITVGYDLDDSAANLDDGSIPSLERVMSSSIASGTTASPLTFRVSRGLPTSQKDNTLTTISTMTTDMTILPGKFVEDSHPQAFAFNSRSNSSAMFTHTIGVGDKKLRIDTVSTGESTKRVFSGNALYPTFNNAAVPAAGLPPIGTYGATFDSTTSLALPNNAELQMSNNLFHYPNAFNYLSDYVTMSGPPVPGPPDYSGIAALVTGVANNTRWFTSMPYAITSEDVLYVQINGAVNFGTSVIVPQCYMQVSVVPGIWFDANSAYDMSPAALTANGHACLDAAVSTSTVRKITLGTTQFTGNAYFRIGFPNNETLKKKFSGVTISTVAPVGFDC